MWLFRDVECEMTLVLVRVFAKCVFGCILNGEGGRGGASGGFLLGVG